LSSTLSFTLSILWVPDPSPAFDEVDDKVDDKVGVAHPARSYRLDCELV